MRPEGGPYAVIFDFGSAYTRAGIGGESYPRAIHPSIIGTPKKERVILGVETINMLTGTEAKEKKDIVDITPLISSNERRFCEPEKLQYMLQDILVRDLKIETTGRGLLMTEKLNAPFTYKKEMAEVIFEKLSFTSLQAIPDSILSLYGSGRTTGTVLNVGHSISTASSICEGYLIEESIFESKHCMRDTESNLQKIINDLYYDIARTQNDIAEKVHFLDSREFLNRYMKVRYDGQEQSSDQEYELPDGSTITTNSSTFDNLMNSFFEKSENREYNALDTLISNSVERSPIEFRNLLLESVVLEGSCTTMEGFFERIQLAIKEKDSKCSILETKNREALAWIGGAAITNLATFERNWISKEKYKEYGDSIFARFSYC